MLEDGWSVILWCMRYLDGWSFGSNYFIGVALRTHNIMDDLMPYNAAHISQKLFTKYTIFKFQLHGWVLDTGQAQQYTMGNPYTNAYLTHMFSWLNELKIEKWLHSEIFH